MQRKKWAYILAGVVMMTSLYASQDHKTISKKVTTQKVTLKKVTHKKVIHKKITAKKSTPKKARHKKTASKKFSHTKIIANKTIFQNKLRILKSLKTSEKHWFLAPALGLNDVSLDQSIKVPNGSNFSPPLDMDSYTTTGKYHASANLTWGYLWQNDNKWFPAYSLGIRYQHIFGENAGENVMQYSLPEFTTYSYHWNISSDVFQAIAKVNVVRWNQWLPYVATGFGVSFNHAENFSETAYPDVIPRDTPGYSNKMNSQLAYNLGLGCDYVLNTNVTLNMGYEYEHLGKVNSGYGVGTWSAEQLKSNTLKSHALIVGFTDLIG